MASNLDLDLVLKLKNADAIVRELQNKLKGSNLQNLGNISLPKGFAKDLQSIARALGTSKNISQEAKKAFSDLASTAGRAGSNIKGVTSVLGAYSTAMTAAKRSQEQLNKEQTRSIGLSEEFGRQTGSIAKRFGGFLIAQAIVRRLGEAFKEAARQAIDFEREIIKLAQFQNTTIEQAKKLGDFVEQLSFKFGTSSESLVKSAQILAQAGRSAGEIKSILAALAPATLTASFEDLGGATESLNALLGQFDISASKSTQVLDELNAVAEAFNVSIDELFDGLKRAGSTFAALSGVKEGITPGTQALREYAALFTTVIDTTREGADTIGTALKTILPRLQRGETQQLLKSFGIDLLSDKGKFVGPLEAFKRISEGLKDISAQSPAFSKIVEELGGSRQFGRVLPLLEEQTKIQRAIEIANNAKGSVYEDAELAQQSLQVQIQKTIERFKELLRELTGTSTFKALAASFLGLANSAITLANSLKELLPLITLFATAQVLTKIPPFSRGFSQGIGFSRRATSNPSTGFSNGGIAAKVTPGEMIFSAAAVKREGRSTLDYYNKTGDPSRLKSLAGTYIVPGTGNSDTVNMTLEDGSYVIKKSSVNRSRRGFNMGGHAAKRQYYQDGGSTNKDPIQFLLDSLNKKAKSGQAALFIDNNKQVTAMVKQLQQIAKAANVQLAFFKGSKSIFGAANSKGILLNSNLTENPGGVKNLLTTFLHELTHALQIDNTDTKVPSYVARQGVREYEKANGRTLSPIEAMRESRAKVFNLNTVSPFVSKKDAQNTLDYLASSNSGNIRERLKAKLEGAAKRIDDDYLAKARRRVNQIDARLQRSGGGSLSAEARQSLQTTIADRLIARRGGFQEGASSPISLSGPNQPIFTSSNAGMTERFVSGARGAAQNTRAFFRRPISNETFGKIQTGSFALALAGGQFANSQTETGQQIGGALTGASIGLQSSLLTANPLIIAFATLSAAAIGAASALKEFRLQQQNKRDSSAVERFSQGKASLSEIDAALAQSTAFGFKDKPLKKGAFASLNVSSKPELADAFRNTSLGERSKVFFSLDGLLSESSSSINVAKAARAKELERVRGNFAVASESQADLVREKVVRSIRAGAPISNEALIAKFTKDPAQARLLALQNKALKDPRQLNIDKQAVDLAAGAIRQLADETRDLNKPMGELSKKIADAAKSSILLFTAFDRINSGLTTLSAVLSQTDQAIEATLSGGITNKTSINNFANPFGVGRQVFGDSINNLASQLGINELQNPGFQAAAQAAMMANLIKTELPTLLNDASANSPLDTTISQTLTKALPTVLTPQLREYFSGIIATNFEGEQDRSVKGLSEQEIEAIVQKFGGAAGVGKDILSTVQELANQNIVRQNQQAASLAGARLDVARQQIGLNQLDTRRQVTASEILGTRSPLADRGAAIASLRGDAATILRGQPNSADIRTRLAEINKTGVTAENVTEFTRLTEALKLLSTDTRVLDATMQKNNELNQAQQGSRNIADRLLGGPQEIVKFNQQLDDFRRIAAGGDVGGPRALEALNNMEQLLQAFTPEQFKKITGISKDEGEQALRNIRGEQTGRILGGEAGAAIIGNIRGDGRKALVDEANQAFEVMRRASEILKEQNEVQLAKSIEMMDAQQKAFTVGIQEAFNNAFNSQGSLDLQKALNNFSNSFGGEGASVEITGKTDVVVSFNGANGVFKDIQKDLEGAIGRIVNEQIKSALKTNQGIAGANSP